MYGLVSGYSWLFRLLVIFTQTVITVRFIDSGLQYPAEKRKERLEYLFLFVMGIRTVGIFNISWSAALRILWEFLVLVPVIWAVISGYNDKTLNKIMIIVFYALIYGFCYRVLSVWLSHLLARWALSEKNQGYYYLMIILYVSQLFWVLLNIVSHFLDHRWSMLQPDLLYVIIGLFCLSINHIIVLYFDMFSDREADILFILSLFSLSLSLAVIPLYNRLVYHLRFQKEEEKGMTWKEVQNKRMNDIRAEHEKLLELRHDTKKHLFTLTKLLEKGYTEEAIEYLREYDSSESLQAEAMTGYPEIDAALSGYVARLRKQNIRFTYNIGGLSDICLTAFELNTIIMNLLDNAEEALTKSAVKDPYVYLRVERVRQMLVIACVNPLDNENVRVRDNSVSGKENKEGRGFGLKIIRDIADRHEGVMNIKVEEGKFKAAISLPCLSQGSAV